ncbi:hypothetical protein [Lactiplantibacillus argentoratensis]|uniref:Uncharacterized protein n=1 Tax=Lactiplantibacillus argentoratensis TaxID=271881 RepID=A0AAN1Q2M1_9LACO|nr:hypothetical protein [Lactiplantibacillus argentoratensis]AYJ36040.1 hypothetical protein LPA65_09810 [Lactiplantibacillus argentoratensis]AYJ36087.1 hypothetical protein LPA65_10125 [Lactiplantibacillus argentoratensis]AYJ36140.1 hypothetical protein LPA65_10440 [Lactiplantibacillus argentoratensis]KRL90090.1 hypothetical protein FD10_GL001742 [Lactiplantibacillus argentoratensis DSM 16365]GEO53938.1 hypothetical protein LPL03_20340 [Lactiplantibacillus argentoratensis]
MSIALKDAVKIVTDTVSDINNRFPIKWEDISNKPTIDVTDFYTKEEVDTIFKASNQLISPDGTVWEPAIDNNGVVSWKKVINDGQ